MIHDSVFTSRRDVESHFFSLPSCELGLGILDTVDVTGDKAPEQLLTMLPPGLWVTVRLGFGARAGLGLPPVNKSPGGEEPSLLSPGPFCFVLGEVTWHGVDLPEEGKDWSLRTGILLVPGNAGNCLPGLLVT